MKKVKLDGRQKAIGTILIFPWYLYFAPITIQFLLKLFTVYVTDDFSMSDLNIYFNLLIGIASLIPLVVVFKSYIKESWQIFRKDLLENIIWTVTIGLGLTYLFSVAGEMILNFLAPQSEEAANQVIVQSMIKSNAFLMFFQAVIIAPIVEELLFRGLIFNSLRQKNIFLAHLVSAFLFGLLHVYQYILAGDMSEWVKLIPYMFTGLSLSIVYEKRKTIFASIFAHGLKNLIATIVILLIL